MPWVCDRQSGSAKSIVHDYRTVSNRQSPPAPSQETPRRSGVRGRNPLPPAKAPVSAPCTTSGSVSLTTDGYASGPHAAGVPRPRGLCGLPLRCFALGPVVRRGIVSCGARAAATGLCAVSWRETTPARSQRPSVHWRGATRSPSPSSRARAHCRSGQSAPRTRRWSAL